MSRKVNYRFQILFMFLFFCLLLLGIGIASFFLGRGIDETIQTVAILGVYLAIIILFITVKFTGGVIKWIQ